jgi:GNAT superfamily N-acetyltransferase
LWFIVYECLSTNHAKLYRMGVERTRQHQGIGSQLLWYAEKALRKQKILTLELLTLDEHPKYLWYTFTRKFYHKYGFEPIESFKDEDVIILKMQKNLIWT